MYIHVCPWNENVLFFFNFVVSVLGIERKVCNVDIDDKKIKLLILNLSLHGGNRDITLSWLRFAMVNWGVVRVWFNLLY